MSKEIPLKLIVNAISNEKGVDDEIIYQAMESALVIATRKKRGIDMDVQVNIDRRTGDFITTRQWQVIDLEATELTELERPEAQITLHEAQTNPKYADKGLSADSIYEEEIESIEFGRIAAQTAKQVILQKLRDAERDKAIAEFAEQEHKIVTGIVKRTTKDNIIVDLSGNAEGILPKVHALPRETFRPGDRVRAYLVSIDKDESKQILLSRTANEMLLELLRIEVPEIDEGIIEVKSIARDPSSRSKVAVYTNDGRIDPQGACIGMRGTRIQAISGELNGEKIDIVLWDSNVAQYVMNAISPAEATSIELDEDAHSMLIAVKKTDLSQAIGKNGQNVKLAGKLTGWMLNIVSDQEIEEQANLNAQKAKTTFIEILNVDDEVASALVEDGFTTIEEVAYVPVKEFLQIESFDEETVNALRERAKDHLITAAIAKEEELEKVSFDPDLLEVDGVDEKLAKLFATKGITDRETLAEQAADDLIELLDMEQEQSAKIIMAARAHWFS